MCRVIRSFESRMKRSLEICRHRGSHQTRPNSSRKTGPTRRGNPPLPSRPSRRNFYVAPNKPRGANLAIAMIIAISIAHALL